MWTIEVHRFITQKPPRPELPKQWRKPNPDYCRRGNGIEDERSEAEMLQLEADPYAEQFDRPRESGWWWKSTHAAADPEAAANFVVDVFGAQHLPCPYPWPPVVNCTAAKWVRLPAGLQ